MKKQFFSLALFAAAWLAGVTALAQFDASKVYTIESNNNAGKYMQDNGNGEVVTGALNANSYWEFETTGNDGCYYVKNAKTGKYMQKTSEYEVSVKTGDTSVEIYIKNDPAKGATVYGMASTDRNTHDFANDNTYGANYNGGTGVVQGFSAALGARPNSFWKIIGHSFTNGVCSDNCTEKYQAPALVDGWYELTNAGNVEWMSAKVGAGETEPGDGGKPYAICSYKLTADIDYAGLDVNAHKPIGTYDKKFLGVFDGDGHSIKNMKLDQPNRPKPGEDGIGFFGCVRVGNDALPNAVIKNLTIDSSCEVKGSSAYVAGIVGRIHERTQDNTLLIENCVNKANITTSADYVAGIVGQITTINDRNVTITFKNCTNEGKITTTGAYAAGILAQINDANSSTVNIIGCTNKGAVQTYGLCAAGIVSQANNCTVALNIESCMNFADVKSTDNKNCGGIHGANTSSKATIKIINCGNTGNVTGTTESAAITGWIGSNAGQVISNCWNSGTVTGGSTSTNMYRDQNNSATVTNIYNKYGEGGQGTVITDEMIASGELCYKLNGDQSVIAWTQTLDGTQEFPLPVTDGAQVYFANDTFCDGSVRHYSNYESGHEFGHNINDEIGMCDVCHTQFQAPDLVDGWYQLRNAGNVEWISTKVESGTLDPDCKLMNDIDMLGIENLHSPIGPSNGNKYNGTFDGQGFRIKNMIINRPSSEMQGFFGSLRGNPNTKDQGTVIKNLIIDKSCSITGGLRTAAITGAGQNNEKEIVIMNCVNEASVTSSSKNVAGIVGGSHGNHPIWKLTNCVNVGKITCTASDHEAAGIAAWLGDNGNTRVTNCINIGEVTNGNNGSGMDGSGRGVFRHSDSNNTAEKCYDISGTSGASQFTSHELTANDVLKGKATYIINGEVGSTVYWQTIGTDAYPMPFNSSQQVREANTGNYTNLTVSDSAVQIGSDANLNKFAAEVNAGNTSMNAVLTSDVDMSSVTYTPIGNNTNRYHGTFDGSGHKVNLNIDANAYGQGFISIATGGVTVKNLVITGTVKNADSKTAGIIAEAIGSGVVTIQNCGNEATIQGNSGETAAIIANNWGYGCTLNIENVYNIGSVSGSGDVSTICACQGNSSSVFKNVYNSGSVTGATQGNFVRTSNGTYTNCYSTTLSDNDNTNIISTNASAVESGELCAKLGFGFRQNFSSDTYPNLASGHGFVAQIGAAGYSTMYNVYSDVEIPSGIEAFAGVVNGESLSLVAIENKIAASEPVVLKLAEGTDAGLFNFMPITGATQAASNDLKGSDGNVTSDGSTIFALSNKANGVGFYPVGDGVTIPAGKAYLEYTGGNAVKGFTFVFDDDDATGISLMEDGRSQMEDGTIYNIAGQRLDNSQFTIHNSQLKRGIYIVNGKKILK